jgi:hypothetical protein
MIRMSCLSSQFCERLSDDSEVRSAEIVVNRGMAKTSVILKAMFIPNWHHFLVTTRQISKYRY